MSSHDVHGSATIWLELGERSAIAEDSDGDVIRSHPTTSRLDGRLLMADEEVRVLVLRRLAEQAMSDPEFRAVARVNLDDALSAYGYDLNPAEHALVLRFRSTLEEAGVDLFLTPELSMDLETLLASDDPAGLERDIKARSRGTG